MTRRDRFLLTAVIPLLVLGGVWFLLLSPKRDEAQRLDTEIAEAHTRLATAEGDLARLEAARDEVVANIRELGDAARAVPGDAAVPALLRQLDHAAHREDVSLRTISNDGGEAEQDASADAAPDAESPAGEATPAASVESIDLTLTVDGRYFPVQRFLARLDRFIEVSRQRLDTTGRLLAVSELDLVSKEGGGLTATVDASVYVVPSIETLLPDGARPAPALPGADGDPAGTGATIATAGVRP